MSIENGQNRNESEDYDFLKSDSNEPVNDDWVTPEAEIIIEKEKPKIEFRGEDMEITVERNARDGKPKRLEGGWLVNNTFEPKEGYIQAIGPKRETKNIEKKKLIELQPFQEGSDVSVIRSNGNLDSDGWKISKSFGGGFYIVSKIIDGKQKNKVIRKSDLINAKITELENRSKGILGWGDITAEDGKIITKINEETEYWKDKLATIKKEYKKEENKKRFSAENLDENLETPSTAA